jgi:hypothetical protein
MLANFSRCFHGSGKITTYPSCCVISSTQTVAMKSRSHWRITDAGAVNTAFWLLLTDLRSLKTPVAKFFGVYMAMSLDKREKYERDMLS